MVGRQQDRPLAAARRDGGRLAGDLSRCADDASRYRHPAGLALFDLEDPAKLVRRGDEWVFGPDAPYERVGDVGNVVFPCGVIHDPATNELRMYYGAADTSIAMATCDVAELLDWLKRAPQS